MPLRNARPFFWEPKTVCDSLDATNGPQGGMSALINLIPDPTTSDSWVCRPNAVSLSTFTGAHAPTATVGFQSGMLIIGNIMYGLIASGRNALKDEPFAYNILTNAFLAVSGITSGNSPTSPATTGDWTPPTLAQIGSRIMVTHPGFSGANKIGWFDISNFSSATFTGTTHNASTTIDTASSNWLAGGFQPGMTITDASGDIPANTTIVSLTATTIVISAAATGGHAGNTLTVTGGTPTAPQWAAGDLNINTLPSVPVFVSQFNGRAYYACGTNGIVFSDSGLPTNRTNANQALTPNNGLPVTALGPQGIFSTNSGIVQALIAFQGAAIMQQITGDPATSNFAMNALPYSTGTLSPLSITPTNFGLCFISPDGMRFVRPDGTVTDPVGDHGTGISLAFINAQNPSRTVGAANADTIRFTVKRLDIANNPTQEFWFDITRKVWSGPHTFPASLIQSWQGTFVMSGTGINARLWESDGVPSSINIGTENGKEMDWTWTTCLLPDNQEMNETLIMEASIMLGIGASSVTVMALDDAGTLLNTVSFPQAVSQTLWDQFLWDVGAWDSGAGVFRQRRIDWTTPLVAKQFTFQISSKCDPFVRIARLSLRYQVLGYQQQVA